MIQKLIQIFTLFLILFSFFQVSTVQVIKIVPMVSSIVVYADEETDEADEGQNNENVNQAPETASGGSLLGRNFGCEITPPELTLGSLFVPGNFIPVIPEACSSVDGDPIPLSPELIPGIIARLFGLIASMIFYFLFFTILISGIMWVWGGIDSKNIANAKQNFKDAGVAILLVLVTYVIISTIIGVLSGGGDSIDTDLNNIFITNTSEN